MTLVADLAARVLLDADLADVDLPVPVGDVPIGADDGRALETRGDAAVQVLLARDVHLAHHVAPQHHGHGNAAVQGLVVDLEGRGIVHLVGADGLVVQQVDDVLAGLELHQGGAVVLAHLRQGGPHVAQHLGLVLGLVVLAGRTAAEQLAPGQELLVHLQAHHEAQLGVTGVVQFPEHREGLQKPGILEREGIVHVGISRVFRQAGIRCGHQVKEGHRRKIVFSGANLQKYRRERWAGSTMERAQGQDEGESFRACCPLEGRCRVFPPGFEQV